MAVPAFLGSVSVFMISKRRFCSSFCLSRSFSLAPMTLPINRPCITRISSPGNPVPASMTMKATSLERAATIGAMIPPSLWPIRPILWLSMSGRDLRTAIPASTSPAKSSLVDLATLPLEPPTPRSSTRSTAMPRRVKASARTWNGLCSKSVSSRSWAPEPLIKITAGNGPGPSGIGKRARQSDSRRLVLIREFLDLVRERRLRRLRPA